MNDMYMDPFCYDSMGTEITSDFEDMICGSEEPDYIVDESTEPVKEVKKEETKAAKEKALSKEKVQKENTVKAGKKVDKKAASSKVNINVKKTEPVKKPEEHRTKVQPDPVSDLEEIKEGTSIEEALDPIDEMFTEVDKEADTRVKPKNNPAHIY